MLLKNILHLIQPKNFNALSYLLFNHNFEFSKALKYITLPSYQIEPRISRSINNKNEKVLCSNKWPCLHRSICIYLKSSIYFCLFSLCMGNSFLYCLPCAHASHSIWSFIITWNPSTIEFLCSNIKLLWLRCPYLWFHNSFSSIGTRPHEWHVVEWQEE